MGKFIDMTGWIMKEHGVPESRLTVIECAGRAGKESRPLWLCQCECGNYTKVYGKLIRNGNTKSCGCLQKDKANKTIKSFTFPMDLTGRRFDLLTPIRLTNQRTRGYCVWECQCECGNICYIKGTNLVQGVTHSCGCLRQSVGEYRIEQILKENHINYIYDKPYFKDLKLPTGGIGRYDFIILNENQQPIKLIEFDGEQHYYVYNNSMFQSLEVRQQNDYIKNQYAKIHNLPLIRIPFYERNNISLELLFNDKYLIKE